MLMLWRASGLLGIRTEAIGLQAADDGVGAGFPGVNSEFQELVKACAEAALQTNDSELQTKVRMLQHGTDLF